MVFLKQSTAKTLRYGPFLDSTDGVTPEIALTISQSDVRLSKDGGAFAQKNDTSSATHDENGWYSIPLNATDTATVGSLIVAVYESGALPVWREFMVVPSNVYDSLISGSDILQSDVTQWNGSNVASPTVAGVPKVDITHIDGTSGGQTEIAKSIKEVDLSTTNPVNGSVWADIVGQVVVQELQERAYVTSAIISKTINGKTQKYIALYTQDGTATGIRNYQRELLGASIGSFDDAAAAQRMLLPILGFYYQDGAGNITEINGISSLLGVNATTDLAGASWTGADTETNVGAGVGYTMILPFVDNWSSPASGSNLIIVYPRGIGSSANSNLNSSEGIDANIVSINSNAAPVNNLEDDYDGTGYAKANSTIGTATNINQIESLDATDQINAACDTALIDYDPPTHTELISEINDVQADIAALNNLSAAAAADAVWDELLSGHIIAGSAGKTLSDILDDTAVIGVAGAGLSNIPWNASWDAEVQSECTDALNLYDPPTHTELISEINDVQADIAALNNLSAAAAADAVWDEDIEVAHGTDATAGLLLRALGSGISNRVNNATLEDLLAVTDSAGKTLITEVAEMTIDSTMDLQTTLKWILAESVGKINRSGNDYVYRDFADSANLFTLTSASASRTRS